FDKPRSDMILWGKDDWPDDHSDYEYRAGEKKPPIQGRPPIKEDQFRCDLKFCAQRCWKWFNPWHKCRSSSDNTLVHHVPKKKSEWRFQQQSANEAWGLDCKFKISALGVLVYHLLMIAGTLIFWAWWQSNHPNDVANAGVPISVMGSLISAFWGASGVLTIASKK
ncbi:hypothetical protein H2198_004534, partial [Neophaeococcomyces mojaviensis]